MRSYVGPEKPVLRYMLLAACAAALAVALTVVLLQPAHADRPAPPMPDNLQVEPGNKLFLIAHAVGTQNYICMPSGSGFAWTFYGPQATLFNEGGKQIATHFLSPNPSEGGVARATWQDSRSTSTVWAAAIQSSTDPAFVAQGAIPWLLLQRVGAADGSKGSDRLADTAFIQRLNTTGGVAPATGCSGPADVGAKAFVPYTADYYFYRQSGN